MCSRGGFLAPLPIESGYGSCPGHAGMVRTRRALREWTGTYSRRYVLLHYGYKEVGRAVRLECKRTTRRHYAVPYSQSKSIFLIPNITTLFFTARKNTRSDIGRPDNLNGSPSSILSIPRSGDRSITFLRRERNLVRPTADNRPGNGRGLPDPTRVSSDRQAEPSATKPVRSGESRTTAGKFDAYIQRITVCI
jgi:hypothetical protein